MTFTTYLQQEQLSSRTIRVYEKQLASFMAWLDHEQLSGSGVTYTELLDFMRWLQDKGKSPRVVSRVLCVLRHYFRYLIAEGEREDNPAAPAGCLTTC